MRGALPDKVVACRVACKLLINLCGVASLSTKQTVVDSIPTLHVLKGEKVKEIKIVATPVGYELEHIAIIDSANNELWGYDYRRVSAHSTYLMIDSLFVALSKIIMEDGYFRNK